jgi:hypothetical protein
MHVLLPRLAREPQRWAEYARELFNGQGSLGNGAAMRVAPRGAWFHTDLDQVAEQAQLEPAESLPDWALRYEHGPVTRTQSRRTPQMRSLPGS